MFLMGFIACLCLESVGGFIYLWIKWKPIVETYNSVTEDDKKKKTTDEQFADLLEWVPKYGTE